MVLACAGLTASSSVSDVGMVRPAAVLWLA